MTLALLLLTAAAARAQDRQGDEASVPPPPATAGSSWRIRLTPPDLHRDVAPKASGLDLAARSSSPHTHPLHLSLDLSVAALRLAVQGDYRPGFAAFLGTSTASLGGLRLRF